MQDYHDMEWGVPLHDDRKIFEFLLLDVFQAGLNWMTILNKRENFRKAFDNFNPQKIAAYDKRKVKQLFLNPGIIRNRLKIEGTIKNARTFLHIQKEWRSFDRYMWQFVKGKPKKNKWKTLRQIPAKTKESDAMSKDLKNRGFTFIGCTICYAFMQASGMVNDHLSTCFRYSLL